MSKPDLFPKTTTAGIAVDPKTLNRVVPESRRPDGTLRKEIKIRPGFTPVEDISRFRGSKQAQMDSNALPKGHIIGWVPPTAASSSTSTAKSKSAKKNEKRKEKRKEKAATAVVEKVKDNWEDDDDDDVPVGSVKGKEDGGQKGEAKTKAEGKPVDGLAEKLEKLEVH